MFRKHFYQLLEKEKRIEKIRTWPGFRIIGRRNKSF